MDEKEVFPSLEEEVAYLRKVNKQLKEREHEVEAAAEEIKLHKEEYALLRNQSTKGFNLNKVRGIGPGAMSGKSTPGLLSSKSTASISGKFGGSDVITAALQREIDDLREQLSLLQQKELTGAESSTQIVPPISSDGGTVRTQTDSLDSVVEQLTGEVRRLQLEAEADKAKIIELQSQLEQAKRHEEEFQLLREQSSKSFRLMREKSAVSSKVLSGKQATLLTPLPARSDEAAAATTAIETGENTLGRVKYFSSKGNGLQPVKPKVKWEDEQAAAPP